MTEWISQNMNWFWLFVCIAAIGVELATSPALVSIWFAAGAFVAMLAALAGLNQTVQWIVFAVVSFLMLILFRAKAVRSMAHKTVATNADRIIGREGRVKETISNLNDTGSVIVDGQEWTARTKKDGVVIAPGATVKVLEIVGVKAIVEASAASKEGKDKTSDS